MSFSSCINGLAARNVITRDQADQIVERYTAELASNGGDSLAAKTKISAAFTAEGIERKRREQLATQAAQRIAADVRGFRLANGKADIVSAITRVFENVGHTGYSSVRGRYSALLGAAQSEMEEMLHATRRSFVTMKRSTDVNPNDLVKAAFGEEAPDAAKAFYQSWLSPAEKLRTAFNAAGGAIGWRADFGLPQWHDAGAMLNAKFEKWRDFIEPRLAWDKMTHPVSKTPIGAAEHEDVLQHVYNTVVMDGWNTREPTRGGGGGSSMANSRSDARFLQFKNADAWSDYNRQFGRGNVLDVMNGHLNGMAKDVAAMQVLGPNPAATTQWLKQIINQEVAREKVGQPSLYNKSMIPGMGNPAGIVDSMYEMARGSGAPRNVYSGAFGAVANLAMGAKLGSAVIVHAAINPFVEAMARAHYGLPVTSLIGDLLSSLKEGNRREIARMGMMSGDAMHTLERGAREQGTFARMTEATRWLPAWTTHYSGLESGVGALRRAWWWSAAGETTNQLERSFAEIPDRYKMLLQGFGINESDWRVMQAADLYEPEQGANFVRWQEIAQAGVDKPAEVAAALGLPADAAPEAIAAGAQATAMKYLEMLHMSMEAAVPSSRWRSRAALTLGSRDGTAINLVTRSFAMFKGFVGSATISYIEALRQELSRNKAVGAAAAGGTVIALTALGTLVLQLKQLTAGKDLLPLDPTTADGRATIMHGLLTSGAMSIFGDFLASDQSSMGHGPLETLAGPVVTGALDTYGIAKSLVTAKKPGAKAKTDAEVQTDRASAVRHFLQNNTPVLSTHWAVRSAYNRVLLDQLQFMMDPNAHREMRKEEDRTAKDTNQQYFWPHGSPTPQRAPRLTPGRPG